jgi:hypothetical protein
MRFLVIDLSKKLQGSAEATRARRDAETKTLPPSLAAVNFDLTGQ